MNDPLAVLDGFLDPATPEGVIAVRSVGRDEMRRLLEGLALGAGVVEELVAHWDETRASPRWSTLLAALGESVRRVRGDIDAPVLMVEDFEDRHGPSGRLFYYYLFALEAAGLRAWYEQMGVPPDVAGATTGALARHGETYAFEYGTTGVDAGWWMVLVLRGEILQVGSLKFHHVHLGVGTLSPRPWLDPAQQERHGDGFRRGDASLGVHIPARTDLSAAALDATFARAREVLGAIWPATTRRLATCQSWMMDERLAGILGEGSRIVGFQRRFELIEPYADDVQDVVRFVFGPGRARVVDLSARSRLQRAVLEVLAAGESWHDRTGWLDFDGT